MLILKAAALPLASGGPIEQHLTPKPRPPPPEPLGQARNRSRGQNSSWCFFKQASLWAPPPPHFALRWPQQSGVCPWLLKWEKGKRREGKSSGQAFDESSKINTVCWGGFDGGIKMSALAKLLPRGTGKARLKTDPEPDGRAAL